MTLALDIPAAEMTLDELIARARPGHALDQAFYTDPAIYQRDIERVYMRDWLYVGHVSQIPEAGDFFLFAVAEEEVIVLRDREGEVRALVNVCRHRGSRVCLARQGNANKFTCPYHAWTYGLDGRLVAAPRMGEGFDKSAYRLASIHVELLHGLIFISFADDEPADFAAAAAALAPRLAPYGLERAKVAFAETLKFEANWKLAVENYDECYHCGPAHPEFARSHSIHRPTEANVELFDAMMARAKDTGLDADFVSQVGLSDPTGVQYFYDRYALFPDYVTGTEDGRPAAPLMGDISDYDGGASNVQVGPVSFFLAYNDHVVTYRFTPRGLQDTDAEVTWLVDADAVEGKDYDLDRLTWLWRVTSLADKRIVEHNQQGVNSRFYRPGPYSTMEPFPIAFVEWYLATIK